MALYRTALRLATLESLRPTALLKTQGPWPTLAADRVFDSRLDPLLDLSAHLGVEDLIAVLAGRFCLVESHIGVPQQLLGI